jgi:hypothetical protein
MSQQLIVIKAGVRPANALAVASIANGKAGFVVEGTSVVKQAIAKTDRLVLVAKQANGTPETTPAFSPADIVKKSKIAPSAGTAQVTNVTMQITGQKKNSEWIVKIIDTTVATRAPKSETFSVFHKGTDFNQASLAQAMADKINAFADIPVIASVSGNNLVLTGKNTVKNFRVAVDGLNAEIAVITYAVSNIPAAGTPAVIRELEEYLQSFGRGATNKHEYPVKKVPSQVEDGATYHLYVFDMVIPASDFTGTGNTRPAKYRLYIAEADTAADQANHVANNLFAL